MSQEENYKEVTKPEHYHQGGLDVIGYARMKLPKEQLVGFMRINIMKYLMRYEHKNGLEDLIKAKDYLEMLIREIEEDE